MIAAAVVNAVSIVSVVIAVSVASAVIAVSVGNVVSVANLVTDAPVMTKKILAKNQDSYSLHWQLFSVVNPIMTIVTASL